MFEQFSNYPEIKWVAAAAVQAIGAGDKIPIDPDLDNFKLVRFKDLRKQPIKKSQLMLIGSSKTNIFIEGPDSGLDALVIRLPKYIGKSWLEIRNMNLENDFSNCKNAFTSLCDPQVIKDIAWKEDKPGEAPPELEFGKIDKTCSDCKNFEPTES